MNSHDHDDALARREALRWIVELTDLGCPDPAALPPGFSNWFRSSERHREAFLKAARTSGRLNAVDPQHRIDVERLLRATINTVVVPFPAHPAEHGRLAPELDQGWASRMRRWPLAACASLLVLLAIPCGIERLHAAPVTYSSDIGQRVFIPLEDGSTMELNTRTRVEVYYTLHSREVRLLWGEASFDVKHDPERPFRVMSGATSVQDIGTQFVVWRRDDGTTTVTVREGRVAVAASGRTETVDADEVATVGIDGRAAILIDVKSLSHRELERRLSWQAGVLTFEGQTLAEAIKEVNRYNKQQLVIADPSIASLKLGGTCRGVDLESFVALLGVLFDVQAVPARGNANVIELKRSPSRP